MVFDFYPHLLTLEEMSGNETYEVSILSRYAPVRTCGVSRYDKLIFQPGVDTFLHKFRMCRIFGRKAKLSHFCNFVMAWQCQ